MSEKRMPWKESLDDVDYSGLLLPSESRENQAPVQDNRPPPDYKKIAEEIVQRRFATEPKLLGQKIDPEKVEMVVRWLEEYHEAILKGVPPWFREYIIAVLEEAKKRPRIEEVCSVILVLGISLILALPEIADWYTK